MWWKDTILDFEGVRKTFLGALPQNELVVGCLFLGVNNSAVAQVYRNRLLENLTGRDPVNGRNKMSIIRKLKLAGKDGLYCKVDGDIFRHSSLWNSDLKAIALPGNLLLLAPCYFQDCLTTFFHSLD